MKYKHIHVERLNERRPFRWLCDSLIYPIFSLSQGVEFKSSVKTLFGRT